ncbi:MAG: hypothetical protein AB1505_27125 [Candidatus Latescibacterota bacterium]
MRTYLQACRVPTTRVGCVEVPRLIMGIHPFDGCGYVSPERDRRMLEHFADVQRIAEVLAWVAGEGITMVQTDHMVPHLNRQHLTAVWKASVQAQIQIGTIPFLVVPLTLDGRPLETRRVYATFDYNAYARFGARYRAYLQRDPIVSYLTAGHGVEGDVLVSCDTVPPYSPEEVARMELDREALARHVGFFDGFEPLVADPGAEIDLLAPAGRFELIEEYIAYLRGRFAAVVTSVHHPGITLPILEQAGVSFDGYITPLNKSGVFMLPTPESALDAIRRSRKPVIAIKPMAGGRLVRQEAFDYVLNEVGVAACMFGLAPMDEVRFTVGQAKGAVERVAA